MTILERVEQALIATKDDSPEPGQLFNHLAVTSINAFLEASAEQGWYMQPGNPTEEMYKAGCEEHESWLDPALGETIPGIYHAMLEAAPNFEWDR